MKVIQHTVLFGVILFLFSGCAHKVASVKKPRPGSYTVFGKTYHPVKRVRTGHFTSGVASWYGPKFQGRKTSCGEVYDMHRMTAAHKTFPMNTLVRVTNLKNGRRTVVRINDRGPFVDDRIIDLSYAAAKDLGMVRAGTARVRVTVLGPAKSAIARARAVPWYHKSPLRVLSRLFTGKGRLKGPFKRI
jgi:rare lipoprotein A